MSWVETTCDTLLGSPHYIAPESIMDAGWTADEMELMSFLEDQKECDKCNQKNILHMATGFGSVVCPLV